MRALWILLVLWAVLFGWSIASTLSMPTEGDGFTRGLSRVVNLALWQFQAAIVAFIIALRARRIDPPAQPVWLFRVPLILAALFGFVVIGTILIGVVT